MVWSVINKVENGEKELVKSVYSLSWPEYLKSIGRMLEDRMELDLNSINDKWLGYQREYTLTCEEDYLNICQGLCPDYALSWSDKQNAEYWNKGHNYKGDLKKRIHLITLSYLLKQKTKDLDSFQESREKNKEISLLEPRKKVCFDIFSEVIVFNEDLSLEEEMFD